MVTSPVWIDWGEYRTGTQNPAAASIPYCTEIAPPARLSLLAGLAHLLRAAATTPYAAQALTTDVAQQRSGNGWQFGQVFGPATRAAQGVCTRTGDAATTGGAPPASEIFADMSGAAAVHEIHIPSNVTSGIQDTWPPLMGNTINSESALVYNDSPSAAMDRQFVVTPALNSTMERFQAINLIGFTCRVEQERDLETI